MRNISETGKKIPIYHERPEKPGLYLVLFHGREDRNEDMDDWGFDGPMIGPLQWCHTTYTCHVRICFETKEDELRYFAVSMFPDAHDMGMVGDLMKYAECFYGDWTVFMVSPEDIERPDDTFRISRRRNELWRSMHSMG